MNRTQRISVNAEQLRLAFDFVSFGEPLEHSAYISLDTGQIYWHSELAADADEDLPDDLETSDRYVAVPHKTELNLGRHLALAFVDEELPQDYDIVAGFFRRRGAYARFKDLLDASGKLDRWYEYEERAMEEALLGWCEENGIQPVEE